MSFINLGNRTQNHSRNELEVSWNYLSAPPIASTISLQSFIGGGNGLGSRPRMKPKSTWKRPPSSRRRRLSRCLQMEMRNVHCMHFNLVHIHSNNIIRYKTNFPLNNYLYTNIFCSHLSPIPSIYVITE